MLTVQQLAIAAGGLTLSGSAWTAAMIVLGRGSNDTSAAFSMLCLPGLGLVGIGLILTIANGFVAVLS